MFRRIIAAATALSLLAMPIAQAQPRHDLPRQHQTHTVKLGKKHVQETRRHGWKKGQRFSNWKRHRPVRDYHRHGLRRPAPGQQWVQVGNEYLLISLATGLILGLAAAR
jgi:Ni/Co efflux regulator RcnB